MYDDSLTESERIMEKITHQMDEIERTLDELKERYKQAVADAIRLEKTIHLLTK